MRRLSFFKDSTVFTGHGENTPVHSIPNEKKYLSEKKGNLMKIPLSTPFPMDIK